MIRGRLAVLLLIGLLSLLGVACGDPQQEQNLAADQTGKGQTTTVVPRLFDPPNPDGKVCRYPIVLVHGFNGFVTDAWGNHYFRGVKAALQADGHTVYEVELPALASSVVRSAALARFLRPLVRADDARVHLIAHSQGGIDARWLRVSYHSIAAKIASVTTVGTPHLGSNFAARAYDWLNTLPKWMWPAEFADDPEGALAGLFALSAQSIKGLQRLESAAKTNQTLAAVPFFSWAGRSKFKDEAKAPCAGINHNPDVVDPLAERLDGWMSWLLTKADRPHDGLIELAHAKYGKFIGCLPADHDDLNQSANDALTGFNSERFYRYIAAQLADLE
ncbi:MAG: alpha/beta fold hydrolase [Deltaproteobacteria bacterium]|nr:alpha/beta fold hydrolase [Deltaproteobacteria bacterium]